MSKQQKTVALDLPTLTGIYIFKNAEGAILYIGKAKNLRSRVHSYFQKSATDWKINQLISEYAEIEYILTKTEAESFLLEAQLIQSHKPPFNVLLKEGQPFLYILFQFLSPKPGQEKLPAIRLVRNKKEKGMYIGPFLQKGPARKAYNFIMRTFQLNICNKKIENGCLDYHIGNCSGTCKSNFDVVDYTFRAQLAYDALNNNQREFIAKIKARITHYSQELNFEKAQQLNEYLINIDLIFTTINTHFSEKKFETDIFATTMPTPYTGHIAPTVNVELQQLLNYKTPINTIDCFDISHLQGMFMVGSCVRFSNGKPDKSFFRRFKIKTLLDQNDYAALQEIVQRRYKSKDEYPDLILIDGGKGQLSAVEYVLPDAPLIASIAKKEEILYSARIPQGVHLDLKTSVGRLLISLRDYAHHFAISYHTLRRKIKNTPF